MIDDIPLYLEVLTALAIAEFKDDTPLTEDPFRLALMTVHAAVRRLQVPEGKVVKGFKEKRAKKMKLITKVLKRTLLKLKRIK